MKIEIITEKIVLEELKKKLGAEFNELIKGVVDIEKGIAAVGGELHSDANEVLLENGSAQKDVWGINIYCERQGKEDFIEYVSLINIRPLENNRSMEIQSPRIREKIKKIIDKLIG